MENSFNLIAVIVAALSAFLVGGLWYSPLMFMKAWQQDAGVETDADKQPHPAKVFGFAALFSLISCMVFSNFIVTGSGAMDGLLLGLQVGFGFVLCSFGLSSNQTCTVLWFNLEIIRT